MTSTTGPAGAVAVRYLEALARQDWDEVTACVAVGVVRHGPFGDDYIGVADYLPFLQRTMPSLPGYRLDIDRVSELGAHRALVELRETIDADGTPFVTHECLTFDVDDEGALSEIAIYIRQSPPSPP